MGKPTGFLETARRENPFRPEAERVLDAGELHSGLSAAARREQASRCMNCGVPYCQSHYGCPLGNLIPEWNDLLYLGREREAWERLAKTAPFPELTGRVCPALCEKACMLAEYGSVTNRDNELFLAERAFEMGWLTPRPPARRTGRRVAVIGSGPAGLAAADFLNRLGHSVTVLERADRAGGLLIYGIPNMKLPKSAVERRVRLMEAEGVRFCLNTEARGTADFDATLLCAGARQPRTLRVSGEESAGVLFAVDYLSEATRALLAGESPRVSARGLPVVVVGGGDTGNDCVATALRQGCQSAIQLELLPAPPQERAPGNPWPEWPRTLRTDYGQREAIALMGGDPRRFETTVRRVLARDGRVEAVEISRVCRAPDGRFVPVEGTQERLPCGLMLIAAGFTGCERSVADAFGLRLTPRGTPDTEGHCVSPGLFVAGDLRTGPSLVVRAMADGLAAAREADAFLRRSKIG